MRWLDDSATDAKGRDKEGTRSGLEKVIFIKLLIPQAFREF